MNIAVLTNVFFPVTNGVVHSIHLLSKGLKELNKEVSVISSKHPCFNHQIIQKYNIKYNIFKLPSIYFPKFDYCIPNPINLIKEIKKIQIKPDIIQINHPFIIYKIAKILRSYNPSSKVVFTYHTQYENYYHYVKFIPKFIYQKFLYGHLKEIFQFVDAVIFPSKTIKKDVENKFQQYKDKFLFICNPVDMHHMQYYDDQKIQNLKAKFGLQDKFVLGFVGRLEKEKNLYKLLELYRQIVSYFEQNLNDKKISLLIVGGGTEYDNLLNYARKLDLQDYVVFTNKVPYEDIPNYYRLLDVFITLSVTEVKPLAYLESLSSMVPIISFKTYGADDLIINEYNGYLIENNNNYQSEFITKIIQLYKNPELLNKLKKNSFESVKDYDYLKVAQKYTEAYKEVGK
ncbi:MAG: glycosyltransferase [bacterium]